MVKKVFIALFIFTCFSFCIASAKSFQTQAKMNQAALKQYKETQKKLDSIIKTIKKSYKLDNFFIKELDNSQKIWIDYQKSMIENLYPKLNDYEYARQFYGTMHVALRYFYKEELTQDRVNQLKTLVEKRCVQTYLYSSKYVCSQEYIDKIFR